MLNYCSLKELPFSYFNYFYEDVSYHLLSRLYHKGGFLFPLPALEAHFWTCTTRSFCQHIPLWNSFHHYNESINQRFFNNVKHYRISGQDNNLLYCFNVKPLPQRWSCCSLSTLGVLHNSADLLLQDKIKLNCVIKVRMLTDLLAG